MKLTFFQIRHVIGEGLLTQLFSPKKFFFQNFKLSKSLLFYFKLSKHGVAKAEPIQANVSGGATGQASNSLTTNALQKEGQLSMDNLASTLGNACSAAASLLSDSVLSRSVNPT